MTGTKIAPVKYASKSGLAELHAGLTRAQVKLRADPRFRTYVSIVVVLAVVIDILGTAICLPALPVLCAYAEKGPFDQISTMVQPDANATAADIAAFRTILISTTINPHAFQGEKGAWSGSPPVGYSLSMNLILSLGYVGSAAGSIILGGMCDRVGCKLPMQTCLAFGTFGYLIMYAAGIWVKSYYLFGIGMIWNNFFGNTAGVAQVYFGLLFKDSPAQRDLYLSLVLGMAMIGGTIGAFVVMPFVSNPSNGKNYFDSFWLAIGLTVFMFFIVSIVLVTPERESSGKEKPPPTPRLACRILWVMVVASLLDSATRMARSTILSSLFPEWSTTQRQNYLLVAMIGVAIAAAVMLQLSRRCFSMGVIAVFGCACTLATQCALMAELDVTAYLIIWHLGKLFGFLSTFCSGFIIQEVAPQALLGFWNERNEAGTNVAQAVAPLIFANVYDAIGNVRGVEMLAATAGVSFIATLAYTPLIAILPKRAPEAKKLELSELAHYEGLSDADYRKLPLETMDHVEKQLLEEGKQPRLASWGDYQEERAYLAGGDFEQQCMQDFKYLSSLLVKTLSDRDAMVKEQKSFQQYNEVVPKVDREKAKAEMGAWIADYFDDAGYINWESQASIYKAMLLNAFPPIDRLDDLKPNFVSMPIDQWEDNLTKFLSLGQDSNLGLSTLPSTPLLLSSLLSQDHGSSRAEASAVMNSHLTTEQRRIRPVLSLSLFSNLLRRR